MRYDIAVIGGGPGGYVAAIYAAKKKARVALIEKGSIGGTCLNSGCIPTKTLIHSATLYRSVQEAAKHGVMSKDASVDWKGVIRYKDDVVGGLQYGVLSLLRGNGITIYAGNALLEDNNKIKIRAAGEEITIFADRIILATGSMPVAVTIPGADDEGVVGSDEALSFTRFPDSLCIIGGGVVGIEMSYIFSSLGAAITVIESMPQILANYDADIGTYVHNTIEAAGVKVYTEASVNSIERHQGRLRVHYVHNRAENCVEASKVLVAVGRKPNLSALHGSTVHATGRGITVDEYMETSVPGVYAVGDATGGRMLAHVAYHQAIVAVKNALGGRVKMDYKAIPSCIYGSPEVGSVGLTEKEARAEHGNHVKIGKFSFQGNGKAWTCDSTTGFVKVIASDKWNEILGVHIVGQNATEMVHEAALAIKMECCVEEVGLLVHAHPTLSEGIMEASLDVCGDAIHKM